MRCRYLRTSAQTVLILVLGLLAVPVTRASDCDSRFQLEPEFYVFDLGTFVSSVVAGDWNEDGRVDLAAANPRDNTVSVLLGTGSFRFRPPVRIGTGDQPRWLAAADMNRDGHLDLVITGNFGTRIFEGNGRGEFTPAEEFGVPGSYVKAGDLDGDGDPDLAVAAHAEIVLVLLEGGTFEVRRLPPTYPSSLDIADFDHDGDLDLVAGNQPGVSVWINDGSAHFESPVFHENGCGPPIRMESVSVGELNGDGNPDIFGVGPHPSACATRLLGRGDGTFFDEFRAEAADSEVGRTMLSDGDPVQKRHDRVAATLRGVPPSLAHVPRGSHFVLLADLTGDGRDESIGLRGELGMEVMNRRSLPCPMAVIVADIDGDAKLDLIVAGSGLAIHPGNGDGTIRRNMQGLFSLGVVRTWLRDFNRDAIDDLAVANADGGLEVLLGTPGGGLARGGFGFGDVRDEFADVNGDGILDELTWEGEVYLGRGDARFEYPSSRFFDTRIETMTAGDLDEDGRVDLALVVWRSSSRSIRLLFGNGDGHFRPGPELVAQAVNLDRIDIDRDGHLDLVATDLSGGRVLFGQGDGTFSQTSMLSPEAQGRPQFGDMDGDGMLDVIVGPFIYLSRGRSFEFLTANRSGTVGDLDGDGRADLVSVSQVHLNNGDGTFRDTDAFGPDGIIALGDRNADGRLDLVVVRTDDEHRYESSATVILNRSAPNHAPVTTAALGTLVLSWPPNHHLAPVGISGITDSDGDAVTLTITEITQDEPVGSNGPDAIFTGGAAQVRLERDGAGNGRVYTIHFDAADGCGGVTAGTVTVCVPHDQGHGSECGDDGQRFNSLSRNWLVTEEAGRTATEPPLSARVVGEHVALRYSADAATPVRLEIFDVAGRKLVTVDEGPRSAGLHEASWNAAGVPRGIYFARLRLGEVTRMTTILLR